MPNVIGATAWRMAMALSMVTGVALVEKPALAQSPQVVERIRASGYLGVWAEDCGRPLAVDNSRVAISDDDQAVLTMRWQHFDAQSGDEIIETEQGPVLEFQVGARRDASSSAIEITWGPHIIHPQKPMSPHHEEIAFTGETWRLMRLVDRNGVVLAQGGRFRIENTDAETPTLKRCPN